MSNFVFRPLAIPEVITIESQRKLDNRGEFIKIFNNEDFVVKGIKYEFVEDSISISKKNVLRGLHYQLHPNLEGKLIVVINGKIFDVAVDLRKNSLTFGKWISTILSGEMKQMIWIPEGFAHGFFSLSDNTEIMYKMTSHYDAKMQRGIIWNDVSLNIDWPSKDPIISERDSKFPTLKNAEINF